MNELTEVLSDALKDKEQTGSDYTAKVTRVEGSTAYVQITGSDIADTPVAMSIAVEPGDMVRVRVANGKAWITGNDTNPPGGNGKLILTVDGIRTGMADMSAGKMNADMSNRKAAIIIEEGTITFKANSLVVDSSMFKLDSNGNAVFSGELQAATGTFSGELQAATGSFNGSVVATDIKALKSYYIYLDANTNKKFAYFSPGRPDLGEYPYIQLGDVDSNNVIAFDDLGCGINSGPVGTWVDIDGVQIQHYSSWGSLLASKITVYEFVNYSDSKLKKNIKPSEIDALSSIDKIQLYSFDWKDESKGHVNIGLVANQLEECIPELVSEGEMPVDREEAKSQTKTRKAETVKQIDIVKLLPYCIKAIQQLSEKAQDQEARIMELEKRLTKLEGGR